MRIDESDGEQNTVTQIVIRLREMREHGHENLMRNNIGMVMGHHQIINLQKSTISIKELVTKPERGRH